MSENSNPVIAVYDFRADLEVAQPKNIQVYRGESVRIVASLWDNNTHVAADSTHTATLYWQTPDMATTWWSAEASIDETGNLVATWIPAMDSGADTYNWFLGVSGDEGTCYRAHGTITMQPAPGTTPTPIPIPTPVLDFAQIEVRNAPWPAEIAVEAAARAEADSMLGNRIDTVSAGLEAHAANDTIHVTATEKAGWDAKADVSDIPAVVAPSTSTSAAGKAADAKATGTALAGKVPRTGDSNLTGNYKTQGSISAEGNPWNPGHIQPTSVQLQGGVGDLTLVSLAEDPTHAAPPETLKLWMANIYADRIERFDGDTGEGTVIHRFPATTGTLALTSQIPDITGKVSKSGDTMTGTLSAPMFQSSGSNGRASVYNGVLELEGASSHNQGRYDADAFYRRVWDAATYTYADYTIVFPARSGTFATTDDIPSVTGKADKVTGATNGNFAGLNASGNLVDSGKKASDFAATSDLPTAEVWTFEVEGQGGTTTVTKRVAVYPAQQGA